jgi:hypothetical protein
MEAKPLKYHEKQEEVWVVQQAQPGQTHDIIGVGVSELATPDLPGIDKSLPFTSTKTTLYRPSLAPIYGGPTLLEALWNEMDRLMEGLMTGQDEADGGDRYRAAELAWVLAIVSNAYDPNVNRIRAEAVERWNAQQEV